MRANNLAQEMKSPLYVKLLGFESLELERLKKIFEQAPAGGRAYVLAPPAATGIGHFDILLVNYDSPAAVSEKNALLGKGPGIPVVAVSRGPLDELQPYHVRGMLIAAKVFGVLDKILLPSGIPTPPPVVKAPAPSLASVPPMAPPPPAAVEPAQATGYRALVVDDSVAIQKSLELNLTALERISRIDFADTGEEALEKARDVRYDLIFLDVMMPGIDGYETCAQLRKIPEYKKTPIIMVSGKSSPLDEVKGVIAGCTTYLTKPVQQDAFQKLSRRVLAWLENYQPSAKPPH